MTFLFNILKMFQDFLIHLLGGFTKRDMKDTYMDGRVHGEIVMATDILKKMESLYGLSSDEWSKRIYEYTKVKKNQFSA